MRMADPYPVPFRLVPSKERNDCTVRACATASGLSYEEVNEAFRQMGKARGKGCDSIYQNWLIDLGAERIAFPAQKGQPRMNPVRFCAEHPKGRYVVKTARHVTAVVDGVWCDSFIPSVDRCIYVAWRLPCGSRPRPPSRQPWDHGTD